jgi:hypothetical protein
LLTASSPSNIEQHHLLRGRKKEFENDTLMMIREPPPSMSTTSCEDKAKR